MSEPARSSTALARYSAILKKWEKLIGGFYPHGILTTITCLMIRQDANSMNLCCFHCMCWARTGSRGLWRGIERGLWLDMRPRTSSVWIEHSWCRSPELFPGSTSTTRWGLDYNRMRHPMPNINIRSKDFGQEWQTSGAIECCSNHPLQVLFNRAL